MSPTTACDISEFQPLVDNRYPHRWLILRCCDGGYVDKHLDHNLAWAIAARKNGLIDGFTVYVVYEPGQNDTILRNLNTAKVPTDCTLMIDVESWGGKIRGDHSKEIDALADALAQRQGDKQRVWGYANASDYASIWPTRRVWLGLVVASYGGSQPKSPGPGPLVGWQYTDGQYSVPGLPNSSAPFGHCDHNQLYLDHPATPATPTSEEFTVDQQAQQAFAAVTADVDRVYNLLAAALSPLGADGKPHQVSVDTIVARRTNPILAAVASPDQIAAAVISKLPPAQTGGLTQADVETAVRAVFADASQEG